MRFRLSFGRLYPGSLDAEELQIQSPLLTSTEPAFGQSNHPAIIRHIPTNRIQYKLAVASPAIMQRLPIDDIVRQLRKELRHKQVDRFGIGTVRLTVTFQRDGRTCQIHRLLSVGGPLHGIDQRGYE